MARPGLGSVGRKGHSERAMRQLYEPVYPGVYAPAGVELTARQRPRGVAVVAAPRRRGRQFGGGAAWREVGKPSA